MMDNRILNIYDLIFFIFLIINFLVQGYFIYTFYFISAFSISEIFQIYFKTAYALLFYINLSMFIAWAVLLKIYKVKSMMGIEIAILFLNAPLILSIVYPISGALLLMLSWSALSIVFLFCFFIGIAIMVFFMIKKSKGKIKLNKVDILFIVSALAIIFFLMIYYI